jgi:hypothetical protein
MKKQLLFGLLFVSASIQAEQSWSAWLGAWFGSTKKEQQSKGEKKEIKKREVEILPKDEHDTKLRCFLDKLEKGCNLSGYSTKGLDFTGYNFTGKTDLEYMDCSETVFRNCIFINMYMRHSYFRSSDLSCAIIKKVDLTGTDFSKANLSNVVFEDKKPFLKQKGDNNIWVHDACIAGSFWGKFKNCTGFDTAHKTFAACKAAGFKVSEKDIEEEKKYWGHYTQFADEIDFAMQD